MSSAILVAYHSSNQAITHQIGDYLTANGCQIYLISERVPEKISDRAKLVQVCGVLLVVADRQFLKSSSSIELLLYAQDIRKKIFGINTAPASFVPFGPLGAIVNAHENGFLNMLSDQDIPACVQPVIEASKKISSQHGSGANPSGAIEDFRSPTPNIPLQYVDSPAVDVLISTHSDSIETARIVEEGLKKFDTDCRLEEISNDVSSLTACKVLVVIMSPGYENDVKARLIVEKALALGKRIVPVSKTRQWKPEKWLGLAIAGILFFRIIDREKAYEKKYDSYIMMDLAFEIKKALAPKPSTDEIERALIESLKKKIEECKAKLGSSWPPPEKPPQVIVRKPVKVNVQAPTAEIEFNHIHYDITRMELKPPLPVIDEYGRPIRKKFDCMISYNWDIQKLVREIYMDFNMRNLATWFDIWGLMEENSYNAMATAVECSSVIVVFLTEKYQKSANCVLEFKYAVFCGKPFVFILNDANLKLEPWVEPHVKENPCFVVKQYSDVSVMKNNMALIDTIAHAIRVVGQAQPDYDVFDLSEEVIKLKTLLASAQDAIDAQTGTSRFKTCDRCKKQYDETNASGCKVHRAYYVGGKIIEGRWVCCNQNSADSVGCADALHSDVKRTWKCDTHYGTYTWEPH